LRTSVIQFGQPVQHPAFQLRHVGRVHRSASVKSASAQHEAHRVAQAAVAVGGAFQDLRPDALVGGVVRLRHPEPQDIGAVLLDHLLGATVLPSDLDIFMPFSSSVKPWVSTR
jgi:hypothetical protein